MTCIVDYAANGPQRAQHKLPCSLRDSQTFTLGLCRIHWRVHQRADQDSLLTFPGPWIGQTSMPSPAILDLCGSTGGHS